MQHMNAHGSVNGTSDDGGGGALVGASAVNERLCVEGAPQPTSVAVEAWRSEAE